MPRFSRLVPAVLAALLAINSPRASARDADSQDLPLSDFGASDKPPKPIEQEPPVYPPWMARAGLIGAVKIEFIIDTAGRVRNPYVVESNNPWFERPAVDAIIGWRYQPAEKAGRPVNVRAQQLIEFKMWGGGQVPDLWQVTKGKDHDKQPPEFQWDTPPMPTNTLFPVYPLEQLKAGIEGTVRIVYIVGPEGRVVGAKLLEAATPEFGLAVLAMIDAWRFDPAKKKDGTPCFAQLGAEYNFRKNGRGSVPVSDQTRWILRDLEKSEGFLSPKELDLPLKPRSCRPPVYPTALAKAGQSGKAEIEFLVDENGDAQLPHIVSCTAPEFGYAAVQAVATWRFEPPVRRGKPGIVRVRVPVNFPLPEKNNPGQAP